MTEVQKRTKVELVEAMRKLYTQVSSITEEIDELKAEAKERDMPAALMAKIAKALCENKVEDILEKQEEFSDLVDEVRNS